eukprot:TRINITY_DN3329_c0_g1_i4.p1 TRINITY_DN3329_c0_g1~~TRINITY_DN3329_c0_g1_i4.p1  ORF type:complete len:105 (-),score=53.21 TRINITY_DN3329_c0_g1_i4:228-542(-)
MCIRDRYQRRVRVKNAGKAAIKVVATFTFHDGSTEVDEATIAAGAEATFNDKTKEEGSMKTIAHITSVDVTGGENSTSVSHPFKVDSPTRNYVFTVGEDLSIQH